jgi:hypothetical protein
MGGYTWQNVDKSNVLGIEIEGGKKLTKQLEFRANVSLINSITNFIRKRIEINPLGIKDYIAVDTIKRTMFGQAPYVINGILSYHADSLGLILTLSYNVQGPKLTIASDVKEIPDIYEIPRHLLDMKATKTLGKFFNISFTVKDILNSPIRRSYKTINGWVDYDKYRYGTSYILSLSYKL